MIRKLIVLLTHLLWNIFFVESFFLMLQYLKCGVSSDNHWGKTCHRNVGVALPVDTLKHSANFHFTSYQKG